MERRIEQFMKNYNRMYRTRDIAVLVLKNWRTASFSAHNSGSIDLENCTTVNFEAYPLRFKMDMDRTSHYFFVQLSQVRYNWSYERKGSENSPFSNFLTLKLQYFRFYLTDFNFLKLVWFVFLRATNEYWKFFLYLSNFTSYSLINN